MLIKTSCFSDHTMIKYSTIALLWIKLFRSESFIITIINEKQSSSIVRWTEMTHYLPLVWLLIHISCFESLFPRTLVFPPALVLMGGTTEGFRMKIIWWAERSFQLHGLRIVTDSICFNYSRTSLRRGNVRTSFSFNKYTELKASLNASFDLVED